MCPGPIEASAPHMTKNIIGITPALPRHRRSARCASLSSMPLSCAWVKSSVTPQSVRKSDVGKPPMTSLRLILA
jgi:hypothetical protein